MALSSALQLTNVVDIPHHISISISQEDSARPLPFSLSANKGITYCFLFLPVLRCFNSRRFSPSRGDSEILGSKCACNSPKLFAACHVLHQIPKPSYPSNSIYYSIVCVISKYYKVGIIQNKNFEMILLFSDFI
jgi:hypothetical protein